jgi:leader peptidase (prepilin peptidase)/N-methyltransferase
VLRTVRYGSLVSSGYAVVIADSDAASVVTPTPATAGGATRSQPPRLRSDPLGPVCPSPHSGRPARGLSSDARAAAYARAVYPLLITAAAIYGALAGLLLLARPGYRLAVEPGEPWRAACPRGHPISGPLAGWLGPARCLVCPPSPPEQGRYGARYGGHPARFALLAAACCAGLAAATGARPELAVWLLAVPVVVVLAAVDRAVQRLPDVLTLPLAVVVVAGLGIAAALPGSAGDWTRALLAGVVLSGVYFVLFLINPNGMGFGDVKLAVPVGVALGWYGWDVVFLGTFTGFLLAAGYGLALIVARRAGRRTAMPFGPFMALGALVALLVGGLAA